MSKTKKQPGKHEFAKEPNGEVPVIAVDLPVMYEDEGQEEMGETEVHTMTSGILFYGAKAHLSGQPKYRVFTDLNCYYHPIDRWAYVSPDIMVIIPEQPLPEQLSSYRIEPGFPSPILVIEVLSRRSFQQQDLTSKPEIYAGLGVAEYILADVTGQFLPQRLLLKQLLSDGTWFDHPEEGKGVTSRLGFRVIIEDDGQLRVTDAKTGEQYARPEEAQAEAEARRKAEEKVRALEEELARLRATLPEEQTGKGRRKKP